MKTSPMQHQIRLRELSENRSYYGMLMEQGTGKTWSAMDCAEHQYGKGLIDCLLVAAPRGVHTNWTRREIPTHMSAPLEAGSYSSGMGVGARRALEKLLEPRGDKLRIVSINYDALTTKDGDLFVQRFLASGRAAFFCDESQRIKTPTAARTKRAIERSGGSVSRRILTGTPITNNPGDAFSQFQFLKNGCLGTTSYRAFMAEYAQLANATNPTTASDFQFRARLQENPRMAFAIIVAKDDITGRPIYRNLDQLAEKIARHSFRVLKSECLDLPPKIYTTRYFELSAAQSRAYMTMEHELRIVLEDGDVQPVAALSALVKLQQITSGYVIVPGRDEPMYVSEDNPRLALLSDTMEDLEGKTIVWARFREEIACIAQRLRSEGRRVVEYHGGVSEAAREEAVDSFQNGDAEVFIGNAAAGGMGLTLTAARNTIYYSNSYNSEHRRQSEDRNHRIGTKASPLYIDLCCAGTVDESITAALQAKADLAAQILRDRGIDARRVSYELFER